MPDEPLPQPIGETRLPPPSLSPEQQELCNRLDEWHKLYGLKVTPSEMFRGAVFAIRPACENNPDGIAQAAHSLREILYPFWSPQVKNVPDKKEAALKNTGSVHRDEAFINEVGKVYGQLNNLAHHRGTSTKPDFSNLTIPDFERLLTEFERVMRKALTRQIDVHREIDQILSGDLTQNILDAPIA